MQNTFNIHKLSSDIGLKLVWDVVGNSPWAMPWDSTGSGTTTELDTGGGDRTIPESVRDLGAS